MSDAEPDGLKLHIGGTERREGWLNVNIVAAPHVDHVGNCKDLSFLADDCCAEVYASHVLEHLGYDGELQAALKEIHRVLQPGGRLRVSVPDLETLCRLLLDPKLWPEKRYKVMRMMFGGRTDAHDVHQSGLTFEFLTEYLLHTGFRNIIRVTDFDEFDDMSRMIFAGERISLNVETYKSEIVDDDEEVLIVP